MKKKALFALLCVSFLLPSCTGASQNKSSSGSSSESQSSSSGSSSSSSSSSGGGSSSSSSEQPPIDEKVVEEYMAQLAKTSQANHFYYHYYRYDKKAEDYNNWDVWAWRYRPNEGQGVRFDWTGRTTAEDGLTASGNATIDSLGYVTTDIDLAGTYKGGWNAATKKMNVISDITFMTDGNVPTQMGFQIVYSSSRLEDGSNFWKNDGGDQFLKLEDFALANENGGTSYHAFVYQDHVGLATPIPVAGASDVVDPFSKDDGTNVTYGKDEYNTADWTDKPIQPSSTKFKNDIGVGYQIMVASFADSDGDGFGDIYGIEQKLDYLEQLGVKALWLTPIQKSDSYHGYDISDYLSVDEKFGSSESPAAKAAGGVSDETAMADYKHLLDAAHEKGMVVVMDLVLNHTSTTNKWFINSAQLEKNFRAFYQWGNHEEQSEVIKEANYWYPYGDHVYSYYAKFGSSMPELNFAYADTRAAVEAVAKNWCEIGVDGFRMDAVKHIFLEDEIAKDLNDTYISDTGSGINYSSDLTKNLNFWRELNYEVKKSYPNAFFVGENFDGHAYHVAPFYEGFDSLFDFYSYFNLTSIASSFVNNGSTGAYGAYTATTAGQFNDPSKGYSAASDADLFGNKTKSIKYANGWNFVGLFDTYNKYRTGGTSATASSGYEMINGAFTSNHDIARNINRVVGNKYDANGLTAQGEVTASNYDKALSYSTLVEVSQLMLPGLTWIYYGDELGMTGNFDAGKDAHSAYADLAYRQPMKWTNDGKVGDGSMTTGYGISGSEASVKWDSVNASSTVKSAEEQLSRNDSHFATISSFAKAKNANKALINGVYAPYYNDITDDDGKKSILSFTRTLGDDSYRVVVNFGYNSHNLSVDANADIVASYNGGSRTIIPARSAILFKLNGSGEGGGGGGEHITSGYGIKFINKDAEFAATKIGDKDPQGRDQYMTGTIEFKAGDEFQLYDFGESVGFVDNIDAYSFGDSGGTGTKWKEYLEKGATSYTVKKDFTASVYIKLKWKDNLVYFAL